MKNLRLLFLIILPLILLVSCSEKHFLNDEIYRDKVHEQFLKRKDFAKNRSEQLFSVFDKPDLTLEQREALEFLYAYMPLTDLADYDGEFFLKQVDGAFEAREYFDWGKDIPEDIFRHFVLVYRINNEYLDTARTVFFEELKDRVKGMSMTDAALEVNHWCHEKVTYRGTDGRTSAPLALVKTSWGRCGEESVLTATALRAVGIPARQCYTPRWVHTDSNHAWVEVWIDGKWQYLGACEPEAELNVAWFTAPSKRAMMVHTNVFGLYDGPEENNNKTELYSTINLTTNYAETRVLDVLVVDENEQPVKDATVQFKVYNYSEFYPIVKSKSDAGGKASIITGYGDVLVWASIGDRYGYVKSAADVNSVKVILNRVQGTEYDEMIEMNPPKERTVEALSEDKIKTNAVRLAQEDSIRNAYMSTFAGEAEAESLAQKTNFDKQKLSNYLTAAQGNWKEIYSFIESEKDNQYLFPFLESLLDKDLRDTPAAYLRDHISDVGKVKEGTPENMIAEYILSPRIGLELITPWRKKLQNVLGDDKIMQYQNNVSELVQFVKDYIRINDTDNYYNCRITPWGVYELKISDKQSRDIFFVAACRSCGIPARLEKATSKPQYFDGGRWVDAVFEQPILNSVNPMAKVVFVNSKNNVVMPSYENHFTLARFDNGDFRTLDFYGDPNLAKYPATLTLETGYYRYMVGSRANDGSVTANIYYFELKEGDSKNIEIVLPEPEGKMQVMGIVDMNSIVQLADGTKNTLKELSNGKGIILCFADPGKEPTKHILQDLPAQAQSFDQWGGGVLFMVPDDKLSVVFDATAFKGLPNSTLWGTDFGRTLLGQAAGALQVDVQDNFPLTLYLNNNGGILYYSLGYRIGIGENLLRTIRAEEATKK